jgi:hypothetical protein
MAGAANPQATSPVGANVYQTSASLYNQAAAGPNIGQFMNPYTRMVTGQTMADLERQRQMAVNTTGQQATQAGAFGGSRHGVAEALTNAEFARQGAQTFGNLQQQGFNTALGAAQGQQGIQSNLANLGFGFGQQIAGQQAQQGALQQGIQQMLMDAAKGQYAGFAGAPQNALQTMLASVGAANMGQQTQTASKQPGLFDYLAIAATAIPKVSDIRLKENIQPAGNVGGVQFYTWDWNDEGKRIASPSQPTFGVIADEVAISHPQHVMRGDDGYLRVRYAGLIRELEAA